jgi:hypothetical protein
MCVRGRKKRTGQKETMRKIDKFPKGNNQDIIFTKDNYDYNAMCSEFL